jgi:uncharacterized protein YlxP (DUF503 family)
MILGVLSIEFLVTNSNSLKRKRMVLRSLKDRLRANFNVSVAELDGREKWQRCAFGIAAIGADTKYLNGVLDGAFGLMERSADIQILDHTIEIL